MKSGLAISTERTVVYPTSDGKPMAETDVHRNLMVDLIETLQDWCAADPMTYVSGNMLLYYEKGNKRKHISPDVFFVRGIPKHDRDYYLLWEEGIAPQMVIEVSSSSTKSEDTRKKKALYRDILKVQEYVLFDPRQEYLKPSFQFFDLVDGEYLQVEPTNGRFRSQVLGLELYRDGWALRFVEPATGKTLPTRKEHIDELKLEVARLRARSTSTKNGNASH